MSDFDKIYTCPICREENKVYRLDDYCDDCALIVKAGRIILRPENRQWVLAALDNENAPLITKEIAAELRKVGM